MCLLVGLGRELSHTLLRFTDELRQVFPHKRSGSVSRFHGTFQIAVGMIRESCCFSASPYQAILPFTAQRGSPVATRNGGVTIQSRCCALIECPVLQVDGGGSTGRLTEHSGQLLHSSLLKCFFLSLALRWRHAKKSKQGMASTSARGGVMNFPQGA